MTALNQTLFGDCRESMRRLIAEGVKVQMCVCSPPYWGLRSYLDKDNPDKPNEMGLEKTPEEYIANMVEVFRLVRELLRDDGVMFVNLGDSYWGGKGENGSSKARRTAEERGYAQSPGTVQMSKRPQDGRHSIIKPKDLVGIPWMLAFALRADGWYLRSEIIWHKLNPMPESVTDRPTKSHEQVFLFAKNAKYYYDAEAVREPYLPSSLERRKYADHDTGDRTQKHQPGRPPCNGEAHIYDPNPFGRNRRSVWTIPSAPYRGAHFATYPPALVEPCVLAGTSERGACPTCGAPWERVIEKKPSTMNIRVRDAKKGILDKKSGYDETATEAEISTYGKEEEGESKTIGWRSTCSCPPAPPVPCVVFDPFLGSGTTAQVAQSLGRNWIGCELNRDYEPLIRERTAQLSIFRARCVDEN